MRERLFFPLFAEVIELYPFPYNKKTIRKEEETSDQIDKSVCLFLCAGRLLKEYPRLSFKCHNKLGVLQSRNMYGMKNQ